uniref:SnoaL-like domain-containing protein n=1 Tax=Zea mays TaxID=4577 RepID=A0A804N1E7_MAIZE
MQLQHGPRPGVAGAARPRSSLPRRPSLPRRRRSSSSTTRTTRTALVVLVAAATRDGARKTTASASRATAADVVRQFYDGVNRRDLAAVEPLIAEGCVYEDLVFPRPFVGRERVVGFFGEFMGTISPDLQFVIDDISAEDSAAVGVTWHLVPSEPNFLIQIRTDMRWIHRSGMVETAWSRPPSPGIWHW